MKFISIFLPVTGAGNINLAWEDWYAFYKTKSAFKDSPFQMKSLKKSFSSWSCAIVQECRRLRFMCQPVLSGTVSGLSRKRISQSLRNAWVLRRLLEGHPNTGKQVLSEIQFQEFLCCHHIPPSAEYGIWRVVFPEVSLFFYTCAEWLMVFIPWTRESGMNWSDFRSNHKNRIPCFNFDMKG